LRVGMVGTLTESSAGEDDCVIIFVDHFPTLIVAEQAREWRVGRDQDGLDAVTIEGSGPVGGAIIDAHRLREELNLQYVRSRPETGAVLSSPEFDAVVLKEQELARTLREVAADDPEYVSLQQVSPLKLEQVQEFISPETTLIEYFITQDEVIAFVVTRNDAKVFRHLAPPSRIRGLQERLSFQLEKFFLGPEYVKAHSDRILIL